MSIWNDCEKYDAVPFYGFPVVPSLKDGIVTFEFPIGYNPDGSKTKEVAKKIHELYGGEIIEVTTKLVRVKIEMNQLGYILYKYYLDSNIEFKTTKK